MHQISWRRRYRHPKANRPAENKIGGLDGGRGISAHSSGWRPRRAASTPSQPILQPGPSAVLRDQLAVELKNLNSAEDAANWAHRIIGAKNTLTASDAEHVERAFQERLETVVSGTADGQISHLDRHKKRRRSKGIDKSVLALPAPRRIRDRDHVKSVATQPCLVCGRRPADAHHLRFVQSPALGRKVSDEFTVPLCRGHHREVHHCGDEAAWWNKIGVDPTVAAHALWLKTHPLPPTSNKVASSASEGKRNPSSTGRGENYNEAIS
jgi:hypothetical protein